MAKTANKTRKELLKEIETQVINESEKEKELKETKESLEKKIEQELEKRDEVDMDLSNIPRIGDKTIEKLQAIGIYDVWDLANASSPAIFDVIGSNSVTQEACTNFVISANRYLVEKGVFKKPLIRSKTLLDNDLVRKRFSTGDKALDRFFGGGGIESKSMTELYGKYQVGKSQICYCTAAATAENNKKVLFVDTENTYSPTRIQEICEEKGYDNDKVQDNIMVLKPNSSAMFSLYMRELRKYVRENNFELIIVDSIIALHRAEYLGRGTLALRQQQLAEIVGGLVRMAEAYDLAVLITNQVLDSPDPHKPGSFATGGNIIAHTSTHRIYLTSYGKKEVTIDGKKVKRDASRILMQDSPRYARVEAMITMGRDGVRAHDGTKLNIEEE